PVSFAEGRRYARARRTRRAAARPLLSSARDASSRGCATERPADSDQHARPHAADDVACGRRRSRALLRVRTPKPRCPVSGVTPAATKLALLATLAVTGVAIALFVTTRSDTAVAPR